MTRARAITLLLLMLATAVARAQDCPEKSTCDTMRAWSNFSRLVLTLSNAESTPRRIYEYDIYDKESIVHVRDLQGSVVLEQASVDGSAFLYKGKAVSEASDCDGQLLDIPAVLQSYAMRTIFDLGHAVAQGPSVVTATTNVDIKVSSQDTRVYSNPGSFFQMPEHWTLAGTVRRADKASVEFDLIQNGGSGKPVRAKGTWSTVLPPAGYADSTTLAGWKVCYWVAAKEKAASRVPGLATFGDLRKLSQELSSGAISNKSLERSRDP